VSVLTLVPRFGTNFIGGVLFYFFQGKIAHAIVIPSVTVEKLDSFVEELIAVRERAFPDGNVVVPCIVEEVGPENCACSVHRDTVSSSKSE
jgi:histidine decarboxylase